MVWLWCVGAVVLDSVLMYFVGRHTGPPLAAMCILTVTAFAFYISPEPTSGLRAVDVLVLMGLCVGFVWGIIRLDEFGWRRAGQLVTAICAFYIGFRAAVARGNSSSARRLLFAAAVVNVAVCMLALFGVNEKLFPVIQTERFSAGVLIERPEVLTDQNFQIFYLINCVGFLFGGLRWRQVLLGSLVVLSAIFVEGVLQSRSGVILIGCGVVLALIARYRADDNSVAWKLVGFCGGLAVLSIVGFVRFDDQFVGMVDRFQPENFATLDRRLDAVGYLIWKLGSPEFWIPQGNEQFAALDGGPPHCMATAVFLEAGLLGFLCWVVLAVLPIVRANFRLWTGRLALDDCLWVVCGTIMLFASLTLNVALDEQVWLWTGAVFALSRRESGQVQISRNRLVRRYPAAR